MRRSPKRQTAPLFPDTPAGMLAKAKALASMCPDKEEWTCIMGFIEYKLAPNKADIQEEVLDDLVHWISAQRKILAEGRRTELDMTGATADDLGKLLSCIVAHLRSL